MVLDATVAGANANSYLTVGEADALAAEDPVHGDAWLMAPLDRREQHLVAATGYVDAYKKSAGERWLSGQALLFPRKVDATGSPLVPFLHRDVKRATYEQAVYLLANAHLIAQAANHRAQGLLSVSQGDGSWTRSMSPSDGLYAPMMREFLDRIGSASRSGRTLISVPIASSYTP